MTSTFKKLFIPKVPFKTAFEALGPSIQWQFSTKLPLNTKAVPTDRHAVGVMQIHPVQDNVAVIAK